MAAIGVGDFVRDLSLPWQLLELEIFKRLKLDMVAIGVGDCVKELSLTW